MKKFHIITLLLIILAGCSSTQKSLTDSELFSKKAECIKYKSNIEEDLLNDLLVRKSLDEIFYSPSLNTCLYSYTAYYVDADGKPMDMKVMGKEYAIIDYLSNQTVLSGNSVINSSIELYFRQRKDELKK